jgi:hypothetical protein
MLAFSPSKPDQLIEGRQVFLQVTLKIYIYLKNKKGKDSKIPPLPREKKRHCPGNAPGDSLSKALLMLAI